ncbi:hypothetical protein JKF63_04008 [Porcisia hertigi]|uniref:Uncharacterized protein n=1 Tax=Porcisia hertigi TaxID=2761500 RepID=A0A836HCU4_9TRYP|nr:hypothetical protein JKF63_04008 [Porcisia hertigi]
MASNGVGSLLPAPSGQQAARRPASNLTSPPLESVNSFAEYADRRHELLTDICNGLEDHVRQMEERAREAVAHASVVAEASRAQETECLEYIERLEDKICTLRRTKRLCVAECDAFCESAKLTRQDMERELEDLRRAVEEARRQKLLAQEEQHHYKMLCDAERHRYELITSHLKDFTAKVEFRFQETVASLQAAVQERKRWADEQCFLCERRVREATVQAEQSDFSAFLHPPTEMAEGRGSVKTAAPGTAEGVPKLVCVREQGVTPLAADAAARSQFMVDQRSAVAALTEAPRLNSNGDAYDLSRMLGCTVAQSVLEGGARTSKREQPDTLETLSAPPVLHASSATEEKHTFLDAFERIDTESTNSNPRDTARPHEHQRKVVEPLHIIPVGSSLNSDAPLPSLQKDVPFTPVQVSSFLVSPRGEGKSARFPDCRLVNEFSCTADAFSAVSSARR